MMQKYSTRKLPAIPKAPMPIITVPEFKLSEFSPIEMGRDKIDESVEVKTFEDMDMGWGSMVYSTLLPKVDGQSVLTLNEAHDYAQVFINGKFIGKIDQPCAYFFF